MDPENLKQIIDLLNGLGENVENGFIWYLVVAHLQPLLLVLLKGLIWIATMLMVAKGLSWLIPKIVDVAQPNSTATSYFKTIREQQNIGAPGWLTETEAAAVIKFLNGKINEDSHA